jgi:hypothetical protein
MGQGQATAFPAVDRESNGIGEVWSCNGDHFAERALIIGF